MKGLKLYALVGGIALTVSLGTRCALADDATGIESTQPAASPSDAAAKPPVPFSEQAVGGTERGIRLDELFSCFNKQPAATAPVAKVGTQTPKSNHLILANNTPKHGTSTTAKHPVVIAKHTGPNAPKIATTHNGVEPAVYKPSEQPSNVMTVSQTVSSGQTPVITAKLDKPGNLPRYKSGEQMVIKVSAQQDCNVIVFDYDAHGTLTQLFPNAYETSGTLHAGQSFDIGGSDSKYTLDIGGKGTERIFVYAYPIAEGPITVAMNPVASTPFRSVDLTPDQYNRLVNESRTYFSEAKAQAQGTDRSVTIKAKQAGAPVTQIADVQQPNKIELTFQIDK